MRSNNLRLVFFRLIHPLRPFWKPLAWLWGILLSGIGVKDGSQWLLTKNADLNGTILGGLVEHLGITLSFLIPLLLLTGLVGLAQLQDQTETPDAEAEQPLILSPQQRLQVIRSLQQEYGNRFAHSLQGRVALELGLHERTDMIASSAQLIFHTLDTTTEYPVAPGTSITQIYDQAQRGLLILGAPGSGKTTLLLDLVLELLSRAENDLDHPIPIVLNLSSWAIRKLALSEWLSVQLSLVYGIPKPVGSSWIAKDRIVFLLDGLDEMEASARPLCIETINAYRREHLVPLVVCSRSREYENQAERLNLPAAVEIQPLEPARVTAYLKQAGRSLAAVRTVVQSSTAFKQLLTTPLMLNIMVLTYQGKTVKDLPHQGSLSDQQRQIFSQYVQQMLERHQKRGTPAEALIRHSLAWLAHQMQQQHLVDFYLEQLQPAWLATQQRQTIYRLFYGLVIGLLIVLFVGIACLLFVSLSEDVLDRLMLGLWLGGSTGVVVGLVAGMGFGPFRGLFAGLTVGPLVALIIRGLFLLLFGPALLFGPRPPSIWLMIFILAFFGLPGGLLFGFFAGWFTERDKNQLAEKFIWSWKACRKGIRLGLLFGLIMGPPLRLIFSEMIPYVLRNFIDHTIDYKWFIQFLVISMIVGSLIFGLVLGLFGGFSSTAMNPDGIVNLVYS